jgi:hypothetical protein
VSAPRYLTKSRFKLAMECPTKLFYTGKKEYANHKLEDKFLAALADGGFQVGHLAKCYFPGGIEVLTRDYDEAIKRTEELLRREHATIFEAAFRHQLFFIRADTIVKSGNRLELIEVKAKSCDFEHESGCHNKDGTITAKWIPYIADVAFQKYVVSNAYPELEVSASLMLADKTTMCATEGLNQKFRLISGTDGQRCVEVSPTLCEADLETQILRRICVDESCDKIYASNGGPSFEQMIAMFADYYTRDEKIIARPTSACKTCEFRLEDGKAKNGEKSGFHECWTNAFDWKEEDFDEPNVLDIWMSQRKDRYIQAGKLKLSQLTEADFDIKPDKKKLGLSLSQRQWKQVEIAKAGNTDVHIDTEGLKREIEGFNYPLHFIDFETCKPVIPFKLGRHPYEEVAFQFSHHTVDNQGRVEHRGEYLNAEPGSFPNYDFVRALKMQLEGDGGSIFRYHNHENTYLCKIYEQLQRDETVADRDELCEFIQHISKSPERSAVHWEGARAMVDLFDLVKRYYYHPATRGSVSLKYVLPAILDSSEFLKKKYTSPIYGAAGGIRSLNFTDHRWVEFDGNGKVRDPYSLLPKLFPDESDHDNSVMSSAYFDEIRDGGAAMTAYCKLQFQELPDHDRHQIESALLKYCELDTLAMVMIYEAWREAL